MNTIVLSLLALVASAGEPAAPPAKALYGAKCASCHAKDAKGNPNMAKMFKIAVAKLDLTSGEIAQMKDEDLVKAIAEGKGEGKAKMPAFKEKLKPAEITELVAYLRSMAPAKGGPAAEKPAAGQ